jgi:hypothetical protein
VVVGNNKNLQRDLPDFLEWSSNLSLDKLRVSFLVKFLLFARYWKTHADLKFSISGTGTSIAMAYQARAASLKQTTKHDYTMLRVASLDCAQ